jgi:hypothetical protein
MRRTAIAGGSLVTALVAAAAAAPFLSREARSAGGEREAAPACANRVIHDWAANGRVTGTYDAACYLAAIRGLPEDLRAYSTAPDDLHNAFVRALQARDR